MSEDQMDRGCLETDVVEEIYEEGSAMLARRSAFLFLCDGYILEFVIKQYVVGACICLRDLENRCICRNNI
jgi:hypothetical protein